MKPFLSRKATIRGGRDGDIQAATSGLDLSMAKPPEMGGEASKKTNPEEIFSMGYAACFASSLEYLLQNSMTNFEAIEVEATTHLVADGDQGFKFSIDLEVEVRGLNKEVAQAFTAKALNFCPYSKAIKGNVDVTTQIK